jgi:hypothetical protein
MGPGSWSAGIWLTVLLAGGAGPRPEDALDEGAQARYRVRVRPSGAPGARLRVDDPPLAGPAVGRTPCPLDELVVVRPGNPARVRVTDGPLAILLWLPPEACQLVVTRQLEVDGKRLPAGLPVTRLEAQAGRARVRALAQEAPLEVWVPADALGTMYLAPPPDQGARIDPSACPGDGEGPRIELINRVRLQAGALLHDAPEGLPVARVREEITFYAEEPEASGWVQIYYHGSWGELRLWAAPRAQAPKADLFAPARAQGEFFWLVPEAGRLTCQDWRVWPRPEEPRAGGIEHVVHGPAGTHTVGYAYRDHLGLLELRGPGVRSGAGEDGGGDWSDAGGGFQNLELKGCGEGCLDAGPHRWFLKREDCERAREK